MSRLQIVLDPPAYPRDPATVFDWSTFTRARLYVSGETITGNVVLILAKDEKVPSISIKFQGKLKVVLPNNETRSSVYRYIIFSSEKTLFQGAEFKMRATKYEWPFQFTVPKDYTPNIPESTFDSDSNFVIRGTQPLPPSLVDEHASKHRALVTYKLSARVPRGFSGWKVTKKLTISPARMEASPEPHYTVMGKIRGAPWEHQRYRYTEDYTPRLLTKREVLSDSFHGKSDAQLVEFDIEVSAPTTVIIGNASSISLRVVTAPTEMVLPDFKVTDLQLRVIPQTHARGPGIFGDHTRTQGDSVTLSRRVRMTELLEAGEWVQIRNVFPEGGTDWVQIVPNFTSMAIRREYQIEIIVKVSCLEKVFKFTRTWPKATFLPRRMEEGVEEVARMIEADESSTREPDEQVPEYEPGADGWGEVETSWSGALRQSHDGPPPSYVESQK